MKLRLTILLSLVAVLGIGGTAGAAIITIDPDAFAVGTDLSTAFAGVTLSAVGTGYSPLDGKIYADNQGTTGFVPSTGSNLFAHSGNLPEYFRELGFLQMRVDFASPTDYVQIDVLGDNGSDYGRLRLYDSGGNLLATVTSPNTTTGNYSTMQFASGTANIAYVLVGGVSGGDAVGLDNLQYNSIPEPASLSLVGLGVLGLAARRMRK